jgi:hypothetical protein
MTMLVIFAMLIGLAIKVAEGLFPRGVWGSPLGSALSLALGAVESFCLTPIMIAFHRFIIRAGLSNCTAKKTVQRYSMSSRAL